MQEKAGIAVLLAGALFGELAGLVAGLAAFVGHCYPVWLGFKGGKGVATFFGLIFAACWPVGLAAGATWLVVAVLSRYSSLSALIASALAPVYAARTWWDTHGALPDHLGASYLLAAHRKHSAPVERHRR